MMIGELEYSTFFVDETLYLPELTRFIFVVFCALIPIVFMNLLVSKTLHHFYALQFTIMKLKFSYVSSIYLELDGSLHSFFDAVIDT